MHVLSLVRIDIIPIADWFYFTCSSCIRDERKYLTEILIAFAYLILDRLDIIMNAITSPSCN
jgi:hypothetical protein